MNQLILYAKKFIHLYIFFIPYFGRNHANLVYGYPYFFLRFFLKNKDDINLIFIFKKYICYSYLLFIFFSRTIQIVIIFLSSFS